MDKTKNRVVELVQVYHPTEKGTILIKGKYEDGTYSDRVLSVLTTSSEKIEKYKAIVIDEETLYEKARKRMLKPITVESGETLEELFNAL